MKVKKVYSTLQVLVSKPEIFTSMARTQNIWVVKISCFVLDYEVIFACCTFMSNKKNMKWTFCISVQVGYIQAPDHWTNLLFRILNTWCTWDALLLQWWPRLIWLSLFATKWTGWVILDNLSPVGFKLGIENFADQIFFFGNLTGPSGPSSEIGDIWHNSKNHTFL